MTEEVKQYWKILNGQCTIRESFNILKKPLPGIIYLEGIEAVLSAYYVLYDMNEIDKDKIFNMGNHSFDMLPREQDFGIMSNDQYIFEGGKWQKI